MKRLTPREVMEKIKEDRKLSNRTKDEWLVIDSPFKVIP